MILIHSLAPVMLLTPTKQNALALLTTGVRAATAPLLGECLGIGRTESDALLRGLASEGLVASQRLALLLPTGRRPIVTYYGRGRAPDLGRVAWSLELRYRRPRRRPLRVWWATPSAERITGGAAGGLRHPLALEHDLGVATAYAGCRRAGLLRHAAWLGEDAFWLRLRGPLPAGATPDAMLFDTDSKPVLAVEYGGNYSRRRLDRFHRWCAGQRLPYQIW